MTVNPFARAHFSSRPIDEQTSHQTGSIFYPNADIADYEDERYNPEKVERLRRQIKLSKKANSLKLARAVDTQRQTALKRRVINLMT